MLGVLIATVVSLFAFGYNTRRVFTRINDEPAGTVTGWIIAAPMMVTVFVTGIVWGLLVCRPLHFSFDKSLTYLISISAAVMFGPLVIGVIARVYVDRRAQK